MNQTYIRKLFTMLAENHIERQNVVQAIKDESDVRVFSEHYTQIASVNARELAEALDCEIMVNQRKDNYIECSINYGGLRVVWLEEE